VEFDLFAVCIYFKMLQGLIANSQQNVLGNLGFCFLREAVERLHKYKQLFHHTDSSNLVSFTGLPPPVITTPSPMTTKTEGDKILR